MDPWRLDTPLGGEEKGEDAPAVPSPAPASNKKRVSRPSFLLGTIFGLIIGGSAFAAWGVSTGAFDSSNSDAGVTANALIGRINAGGVDCKQSGSERERPIYSYDWGACVAGGEQVSVVTFTSSRARDAYADKAKDRSRSVVEGPDWRVTAESERVAVSIGKALDAGLTQE